MELNQQVEQFSKQGLKIAAVTYDKKEALSHFAQRRGIAYPLLSDEGSKVIQAFGILNGNIPPDNAFYGVPFPGTYVLDENGVVKSKYFEEEYRERTTAGSILLRAFRADGGVAVQETQTRHLTLRSWATNAAVYGGSRLTLALDVDLKPNMHVYAPEVRGYIPIKFEIRNSSAFISIPSTHPKSEILRLDAIDESVPVYSGSFRLTSDIVVAQAAELAAAGINETIPVEGSFRYQACDDKMCYRPETVPLRWTLTVSPHDRQRVPAPYRSGPK